ncbi:dephospho-CoA kinase [uncultured Mobiluncus sp.]|uniref:dephospho-CoA kinase n=1 Tax=uncultured Mobiluncus sp. TaxID=293425 RepID=UPI002804C78E|nr:dephospho-CoA kinase [uncultured Mobiluncus sp.]
MIKQLRTFSVPDNRALKVAVSGGIGSGKTTFTNCLAALGGVRFDADEVLRAATGPQGCATAQIREAFGAAVWEPGGQLNRAALAQLIFSDPAAKARLEGILHPLVWQEMDRVLAQLGAEDVLVAEIPLLTETGNHTRFDCCVMVDAPLEVRLARLTRDRQLTEAQAHARIDAQASRDQREAIATFWVDNYGTRGDLEADAAALWKILSDRPVPELSDFAKHGGSDLPTLGL